MRGSDCCGWSDCGGVLSVAVVAPRCGFLDATVIDGGSMFLWLAHPRLSSSAGCDSLAGIALPTRYPGQGAETNDHHLPPGLGRCVAAFACPGVALADRIPATEGSTVAEGRAHSASHSRSVRGFSDHGEALAGSNLNTPARGLLRDL